MTVAALPEPVASGAQVRDGTVWMEPTRLRGEGLVVFAEEAAPLEDAIARALRRAGLDVVPLEERRVAVARMRAGRLPDRDGGCAPMPPPARWLEARYEGARMIVSSLDCRTEPPAWMEDEEEFTPGCILRVEVRQERRRVERAAERVFRLGVSSADVIEALDREGLDLQMVGPDGGGASLLLGMLGDGARPPVIVRDLEVMGTWDATLASHLDVHLEQALAPHREELLACDRGEPHFDFWANDFVIEVARDGRITRCEPEMQDHNARASFACECGVMARRLDFGAGLGLRRLRFATDVDRGRTHTRAPSTHDAGATFRVRDASDRTVMLGSAVFGDQLRACLADLSGDLSPSRLLANLVVGADGRVTEASVRAMPGDVIALQLEACALEALHATRLTCPFEGEARVRGEIDLYRVRRGDVSVERAIADRVRAEGLVLPTGRWHFDTPLHSAPVFYVSSSSRRDAGGALVDAMAVEGEDVKVVATTGTTMGELAVWLRTLQAPRLRRIFFAIDSGDELPTWSVLYVSAPSTSPADVLAVSGARVAGRVQTGGSTMEISISSPDARGFVGAVGTRSSAPVVLEITDDTSLQQALHVIDAVRSTERRAAWQLAR